MAKHLRKLGVVTAGLAGAWLALELLRQPGAPPPPPDTAVAQPEPLALPDLAVQQPLLAEFKTTLERPLFNQERRPEDAAEEEEVPVATPTAPIGAPPFRLAAVIVDADGRSALLEQPGQPQGQRVREGDTVDGWRLESVQDDRVVLNSGGRTSELVLRSFDAPAAPPPVNTVNPRARTRPAGLPQSAPSGLPGAHTPVRRRVTPRLPAGQVPTGR